MILNNVGDDAVKAKTGHDWSEWLKILDEAGAAEMSHKEIVSLLVSRHDVPDWWCQMVTVGYEQARGLREKYQQTDGYQGSASKTINRPVADTYHAWMDEDFRKSWLGDAGIQIKKATTDHSLRITWLENQTPVDVYFYVKGTGKTQVTINHSKLTNQDEVNGMKQFWAEALSRLKTRLE